MIMIIFTIMSLMLATITMFVANLFRQPRGNGGACKLKELCDELELLQIPLPELPPARQFFNIRNWIIAHMRPTMRNRERGLKQNGDKEQRKK